jgi:transcriptional regulator with XRE-family HTH domain
VANFRERINLLYDEAKDNNYRITQDEFSAAFGATRNQLTGWLDGRGEPGIEMLKNIAKASGVSVGWLVGETDLRTQEVGYLEQDWPDVVNILRQLGRKPSFEEQRRIANIVKAAIVTE